MFKAVSKVHLQRDVMRETDMRLVAYSQTGIFLSVIVFSLILWAGEHYINSPLMTAVLSIGLVVITLIRAYFLFRFEAIYPKGPNQWRNIFFSLTLLGAVWWGTILAVMTWVNGLDEEVPILWLYTVGFFAGSLYVVGPFKHFLKIYMAVAFIPCSLAAFLLFEPVAAFYGAIMLMLYYLLYRQGVIIGDNYWDKLQATYDLLKKTKTLEAEKISTQSSLNESDVIFSNIARELTASVQEIASSLSLLKGGQLPADAARLLMLTQQKNQQQLTLLKNLSEIKNIEQKSVLIDSDVIDLRHHVELALSRVSNTAHTKGIELHPRFSTGFPLKVRGDGERVQQLVSNLITSACQYCDKGELLIDCRYQQEADSGIFRISATNHQADQRALPLEELQRLFSPRDAQDTHIGLSLAVVKGLASYMGGFANVHYKKEGALVFWASAALPIIAMETVEKQALITALSDKRVLVYRAPEVVSQSLSMILHNWGLHVDFIDDEDAMAAVIHSFGQSIASTYDLVMLYTQLENDKTFQLSVQLCQQEKTKTLPQIIAISQMQSKTQVVEQHVLANPHVKVIYKPLQQSYLKKLIKSFLVNDSLAPCKKSNEENILKNKQILLFQKEAIDSAIIKNLLERLGCTVFVADTVEYCLAQTNERIFHGFICESHLTDIDLSAFVSTVRNSSKAYQEFKYKTPVIGFTNHQLEGEESHCLASGMDCYLNSPVDIDDLEAVLKRFIGRAAYIADIDPVLIQNIPNT
ncbi:ATP-binding response regulator [Eionea flava]